MWIAATSSPNVWVPVYGPAGTNWAAVTATIAFAPLPAGAEPAVGDYKPALIVGTTTPEAVHQVLAGDLAAGEYMVWVRLLASPEDLRLPSGRLRVGDVR